MGKGIFDVIDDKKMNALMTAFVPCLLLGGNGELLVSCLLKVEKEKKKCISYPSPTPCHHQ